MIAVVISTYNRKAILKETLERSQTYLKSDETIKYFICDDGSTDGSQDLIYPSAILQLIQNNRVGLGANTNSGLRVAFKDTDIVLQYQDDMWLNHKLYLDEHVRFLRSTDNWIKWIRLGQYLYPPPEFEAKLAGEYWEIDWNSPELYIASDKPHIKHIDFHKYFGYYPEGLKIGDTENKWVGHTRETGSNSLTSPKVGIAANVHNETFSHVGESWQGVGL